MTTEDSFWNANGAMRLLGRLVNHQFPTAKAGVHRSPVMKQGLGAPVRGDVRRAVLRAHDHPGRQERRQLNLSPRQYRKFVKWRRKDIKRQLEAKKLRP